MNALDIPRRLFPKRATIKATHAGYWREAPSITTTSYFRCEVVNRSESWCGEKAPQGMARCVAAPHWEALETEARRVGWPEEYRRDVFVHDRNYCARLDPSVPFVWVLRTCGSHLFPVTIRDGVGHGAEHFAVSCPETFGQEKCRVYTWDGSRLTEHRTPEHAADRARELERSYSGQGTGVCFRAPHASANRWIKSLEACAQGE